VDFTELLTKARPTLLVVDDAIENLMVMEALLEDDYQLKMFSEAKEALSYANSSPPDLILLDIMMPDMDGYEFCRRVKTNLKLIDVPVIFITSKRDVQDEEMGFSVGASDFIHKPISAPILTARVKTHLKIKFMLDCLKDENTLLLKDVTQTSRELVALRDFIWNNNLVRS
jgi:putative two-component system response regulator